MNGIARAVAAVLLFAVLGACERNAATQSRGIAGPATVVDGDTIEIHSEFIRLWGIDAPEGWRSCGGGARPGERAASVLRNLTRGQTIRCELRGKDGYGNVVAQCSTAGADLGAAMVSAGWARDAPRYSAGRYAQPEADARSARRGMWAMACAAPSGSLPEHGAKRAQRSEDDRSGVRSVERPRAPGCVIKGNINARGERIYHVPGGEFYDRTGINASLGERWFCTEREARAAGWRRSLL